MNAPIEVVNNPGNCNGTVIPQNYVYDTLSYGNIQAATDNFTLGFGPVPGSSFDEYSVTVNRGPRLIIYPPTGPQIDVTGQSTTVAVGQSAGAGGDTQDYLSDDSSVTSYSYNQTGTLYESYQPSSGNNMCNASVSCPLIGSGSGPGFGGAYIDPGTYTETYTYTTSDGASGSVSTTFTAVAPTNANIVAQESSIRKIDVTGAEDVELGNFPHSAGITFTGSETDPPGFPGTLEWVQLINSENHTETYTSSNGATMSENCVGAPMGLDTRFPYDTGPMTDDSPELEVSDANVLNYSPATSFTMYLLWIPNNAGSIPVPLGYINLGWSAGLQQRNGTWGFTSKNAGPVGSFVSSDAYPQWNALSTAGTTKFTCTSQ